jgi:hypothetical protein
MASPATCCSSTDCERILRPVPQQLCRKRAGTQSWLKLLRAGLRRRLDRSRGGDAPDEDLPCSDVDLCYFRPRRSYKESCFSGFKSHGVATVRPCGTWRNIFSVIEKTEARSGASRVPRARLPTVPRWTGSAEGCVKEASSTSHFNDRGAPLAPRPYSFPEPT